MNNLILNYILKNFVKNFFIVTIIFYCFGVILNLFEEVEFFKNTEENIFIPLLLTSIFVPSLIIKLLPFIIFISSIWFMLKFRNSKDLLTLKMYGYSNIKIFFILAFTSFVLGWVILFFINPVTSSLVKYYEKTKSNYARDIDHLVTFNRNGLWIKENLQNNERIITAAKMEKNNIYDVKIFDLDKYFNLKKKIVAKSASIKTNEWILQNVKIFIFENDILQRKELTNYSINSIYNYDKIINLFNNSDTFLFLKCYQILMKCLTRL